MKPNNNRLEELMKINPRIMTAEDQKLFLDELKQSQLYLPIEILSNPINFDEMEVDKTLSLNEPLKFKPIKMYDLNDVIILPLFTNSEEFKNSQIKSSSIVIPTEDLANMLNDTKDEYDELMINPGTENQISMKLTSFLDLFIDEMFDVLLEISKIFKEKSIPLQEDYTFYLREPEAFMKKKSKDGVFSSENPFNVSLDETFHIEYPYLNILKVKAGTKLLYIGELVNQQSHYDTILKPGIKFRLIEEINESTFLWESIN